MGHVFYPSPIGILKIESNELGIQTITKCETTDMDNSNALCEMAKNQLDEYFRGSRQNFDLPIDPKGTDFEKKVWNSLLKIPYGETTNYGKIAKKISTSKAVRAVGKANGKNPIPIVIPCHRVIGKDRNLIGFALGIEVKRFLLHHENPNQWPVQTALDL